ncbi:4-hydroxythreonine-4-phosphate dehydrogenase [Aquisphaera giovannonii]|uniref:4-hydroxythreonine-4-phosphate dehydrogenase n=1 Tax=Aquisphaera giovannonii TaxID=406548 RepID=A0A5B9W8R6_9BACT|nr:4-hydroxythreonine-4-phosphate dehydrogenase PdxA [Aquisphaera giovannonii]QEH36787.1 4-hydroxythreonine-4-phosphate dehydrogenase [Aquisphaera giovannonii]
MAADWDRPRVALTMGDVAGIGPEVIARAWSDPVLHRLCSPLVIGDVGVLRRACKLVGSAAEVASIAAPAEAIPSPTSIPCFTPHAILKAGTLADVPAGRVDRRAGFAAHEFLNVAIDEALDGRIDALVTLPLNKESLRLAGVRHPGHTEILAERCEVAEHAMMLYLAASSDGDAPEAAKPGRPGLGVVHVTLHVALRQVFDLVTIESVLEKIRLAHRAMRPLTGGKPPRVAASSLNPHAGENGLFGDEEIRIIAPAVRLAAAEGIDVHGPYPNDTLYHSALAGAFDAVVAMYHDQGHIALKTAGFRRAVNVTLGLPIVRTSVAHGTAFDIAWKGVADPTSLIEAVRVAARLAAARSADRARA